MKKVVLTVLVLTTALLVLVPGYAGRKAQQTLDQLVAQINESRPGAAHWRSYHQGWFGSEAALMLDLSVLADLRAASGEPLQVPLQLSLRHGPLIVDQGVTAAWFTGRWYLDRAHEGWLKDSVQGKGKGPLINAAFNMSLAGTVTSDETALPLGVSTDRGLLLLEGYRGKGVYKPSGRFAHASRFDTLSLHGDDNSLRFENAEVDIASSLRQRQGGVDLPGHLRLKLKQMAVGSGADSIALLRDLSVESVLAAEAQDPALASFNFAALLGRGELHGDAVMDAAVDLNVRRLSLAFVEQYLQLMRGWGARDAAGGPLQRFMFLSLVASELLPPGPDLTLEQARLTTPEGNLWLSGYLRLREGAVNANAGPLSALPHLQAELNVLVDKPLTIRLARSQAESAVNAEGFALGRSAADDGKPAQKVAKADELIKSLLQQGLLQEQGGQLVLKATLADGVAVVNGKPLPLPF